MSGFCVGNHVCVKSLGVAHGMANAQPPGRSKSANTLPLGQIRRTNFPQFPGGIGVAGID